MEIKDPFKVKQPKIFIQQSSLGPHRERVFELAKEVKPPQYTKSVWVIAALCAGFVFFGTVFNLAKESVLVAKSFFEDKTTIVFTQATTTSPLLGSDDVFEEDQSEGTYFTLKDAGAPKTMALSYLVADVDTGEIILEKNSDMVLPIASISKLLTALVAKDLFDPHESILVSKSSIDTYGTSGGLFLGEKILVLDLFYPLLMESSNDAAEVFARAEDRTKFLSQLNQKAIELQMLKTSFEDPSGLSSRNVSTAQDLLKLVQHIDKNHKDIWDITRVKEHAILKHKWQNGNNQLKKSYFIGGKNGFTDEALKTTVSVFDIPFVLKDKTEKQKRKIAVVVLRSNDRDGDVDKLLRFIEQNRGFAPVATEEFSLNENE